MAEVNLKAVRRTDTGKGAARRSRASGNVPGIIYGRGIEPIPLEVNRRELALAFNTDAGMNVLLDLEVDGDNTLALAKEIQRDPVRGVVLHADFIKVDRKQQVEVEVPVHLTGESPGAKSGGVLEQPLFAVMVRSIVTAVPESIDADISGLEIGDSLRLADVPAPEGAVIIGDPDTIVASVAAPISEAELEAMEAEVGAVAEAPEEGEVPEAAAEEGEAAEGAEEAAPSEGEGDGE